MRITYITAGVAGSYCGACERDVALVIGLNARGHDVQLVPLYMPIRTDGPDPSLDRVFYGGVNAWLQQHCAVFRRTPACVDWLFDRPALLRWVSRFAIRTRAEDLGEMTVSVLRGADGRQRKELEKLIRFLERGPRPDLVNLTNSLLSGLAPAIRERLGVPVVCTLQGEESFVAQLPAPHREQAQQWMRVHAQAIDLFIAPYEAYADEMSRFLDVPRDHIRVIRPAIHTASYRVSGERVREPFRIGCLSRLCPDKGLDILVEAFCILERECPGRAVLAVAGQLHGAWREFWQGLCARLAADGLSDRLEYAGAPDLMGKVRFLKKCSVFCLPSRVVERRGLACIEALAAGVPVVVPERGVFPEMLDLTGGGVAVAPDDPRALAESLASLRDDPGRADAMARAGAAGVVEHFSVDGMARQCLEAYEEVLARAGG